MDKIFMAGDLRLLDIVSSLPSKPTGAYNVRKNGSGAARSVTENIDIVNKADGSGIEIMIKANKEKVKNAAITVRERVAAGPMIMNARIMVTTFPLKQARMKLQMMPKIPKRKLAMASHQEFEPQMICERIAITAMDRKITITMSEYEKIDL